MARPRTGLVASSADPLAEGVVGVPTAVRETGLTRRALYDAIAAGHLPHVRVGRRKLIPRVALRVWMAARVRHGG